MAAASKPGDTFLLWLTAVNEREVSATAPLLDPADEDIRGLERVPVVTQGTTCDPARTPETAMARVLQVPDRYRRFTVNESELSRCFGISDTLLVRLLDLGLPSRAGKFDRLDLDNVGLILRLPRSRYSVMRWWSKPLIERTSKSRSGGVVSVRARCPAPGHPGDCSFAIAPELVDDVVSEERQGPSAIWYRLRACPTASERVFESPFTDLFERVLPFHFHLIPPQLCGDLCFLANTGLANCYLAAMFLVSEAARFGLPVRAARGIFIVPPYPVEHCWVECQVDDGQWLPADPFMLNALRRWGIIGDAELTGDWSLQSVLWRTGTPFGRLVTHRGDDASYVLTLRLT